MIETGTLCAGCSCAVEICDHKGRQPQEESERCPAPGEEISKTALHFSWSCISRERVGPKAECGRAFPYMVMTVHSRIVACVCMCLCVFDFNLLFCLYSSSEFF